MRSTLLSGLEAAALTEDQYALLESQQCKFLRKLLCGRTCLKLQRTNARGEDYVEFRAFNNDHVRRLLRVSTVESEMVTRRLRWLQQMVAHPSDSIAMLSALQGVAIWENDPPIDSTGGILHLRTAGLSSFTVTLPSWLASRLGSLSSGK